MSQDHARHDTAHHPKPYHRRMSTWWWLENRAYTKFFVREMTSVFVAFFAILSLCQIQALDDGPDAYAQFIARLRSPLWVAVNAIALVMVLYHTVTWFNAVPASIVARVGGKRVPDAVIIGSQYVAWALVSGVIAWILLRG